MKRILFFLFVLIFAGAINSSAQTLKDTIEIKKSFFGARFYYYGEDLRPRMMPDLMKNNSDATEQINIAKHNHLASTIIGYSGGAMLAYSIARWAYSPHETPNYIVGGIGGGCIMLAIPFSIQYTLHAKRAVTFYNNQLRKTSLNKTKIKFEFAFNKVCMRVGF